MESYQVNDVARKYVELDPDEAVTAEEVFAYARDHEAIVVADDKEEVLISFDGSLRLLSLKELRERLDPFTKE